MVNAASVGSGTVPDQVTTPALGGSPSTESTLGSPAAVDGVSSAEGNARSLWQWQEKLLPFTITSILLMAIFFFAASLYQLFNLQQEFHYQAPPYEAQLAEYEKQAWPAAPEQAFEFVKWKTMIVLEQEVMKRRYQQVNAAILTRVWTRYLGFLVGMILALIGAIFILAKLQEQVTKLSAEGQGLRGALETSSPGIVLAVLGTVLVGITLVVPFEFSTRDLPVYTRVRDASPSLPPPILLEEAGSTPARPTVSEEKLFAPRSGTLPGAPPQPSKQH